MKYTRPAGTRTHCYPVFGLLALYLPWWHIDASVARAWTKQAASTGTKSAIPAMYNIVYVTTTNYTKSQLDYSIYAWTKKMNSILTQFMGHFKSVAMFWQSVVLFLHIRVGTMEAHWKNICTFFIKNRLNYYKIFSRKRPELLSFPWKDLAMI